MNRHPRVAVDVTVAVDVRDHAAQRLHADLVPHRDEVCGIDIIVAVHVAGCALGDAVFGHPEADVVLVVVAVAIKIAVDVGVDDPAAAIAGFDLQGVIRASINAIINPRPNRRVTCLF